MEIRHLRQDVVADDEIGPPPLRHKAPREIEPEELDQCRNIPAAGSFRHIGGGLDAQHRYAVRQEMLKQISVVACDLDHLAARTKAKAADDHLAVSTRMLDPGGRIR